MTRYCLTSAATTIAMLILGNCVAAWGQEARPRLPVDTLPRELVLDVVPLGLVEREVPPDNPLTLARVALGRRLFFDAALSGDQSLSCASCHDPAHAFATTDARAIGYGGLALRRNSPTLLNRAYGRSFFWDGRSGSLEEQALKPIESPQELNAKLDDVVQRLSGQADYVAQFQQAFGDGPITATNLARALAAFERALVSGNSPVDQFQAKNARALGDGARLGLWVFESKGRCWRCHADANYTDERFHNTGVAWGAEPLDLGRFEVTGVPADRGAFKTPTLRDIARTPPYMHDGSIATLREVVEFYNRGGGANPHLDPLMQPLGLTPDEVGFLVEFLEALTGELPRAAEGGGE